VNKKASSLENEIIAVFDFDGTIVSKDTGYEFYKWLIKQSSIRVALLAMLLPLVVLLCMTNSLTRKFGLSIASYVATAFQSKSLFRLRAEFIHYYFNEKGAVAYNDALDKIKMHQDNNHQVLIISGCPHWLLSGVVKHIGIRNVKLIGTELNLTLTGLLFTNHCFAANKVAMAYSQGFDPKKWRYGYSDSTADIPMLKDCDHVHVINTNKWQRNKFEALKIGNLIYEKWV